MRKPVFAIREQQRRRSDQAFVIHCLDSIISVVSIRKISSLWLVSIAKQAGLSLTWSPTPKTGFLVMGLIYKPHILHDLKKLIRTDRKVL